MSWSDNELVPRPDPQVRERRIAAALMFTTCCSVFLVTAQRWADESLLSEPGVLTDALVFTMTLMTILLAHELGHYIVAARHRFSLSMPWFLPAPFLIGTFSAIIRLRDVPKTRTILLEMGAGGPLAGLAVIVVAAAIWLVRGTQAEPDELTLTRPLLIWLMSGVLTAAPPPEMSARDPLAFATWLGCLVTSMNLLPFGQLDGGHVTASLWPDKARTISWVVTGLMLAGIWLWWGWAAWVILLHLMGTSWPAEVRSPKEPLTTRARWVAVAAACAWVLCFTPIPVS